MTVEPGTLTVGIFDAHFRSFAPSIVNNQQLPPGFRYIDQCDNRSLVDVVLVTAADAGIVLHLNHPRKALWLQEPREIWPTPPPDILGAYDLVLSHDAHFVADAPERRRWLTLLGTWITDFTPQPKTDLVSMISSAKSKPGVGGYELRHRIAAEREITTRLDGKFGPLFGARVQTKDKALKPYYYSVVVENVDRRGWMTEKLFDCFATRTVPLYWGSCGRLIPLLGALGFDASGVIPFGQEREPISDLKRLLDEISPARYESMLPAIEHNWRRIQELPCAEIQLARVLRDYFGLGE